MKYCPRCKLTKESVDFARNNGRSDGLQAYCRVCKALWDHENYLIDHVAQKERVRKHIISLRVNVWNYLKDHPCIDCGESNPVVLEFDHRDNVIKKGSISNIIGYSKCSWNTLQKEIEKCDIRCANCHRIKTAKQLGWYKYLAL